MPGPLIGLAPATIQIMRMAAQQGVKMSAREAAKLAAKRQAGLQAATVGTRTASEGLATKVLGNKALQDATLATAMGSIPVGTGVAGYLYGLDNPREEPMEEEGIEALIRKDTDFANGGTVKRRVPDVYFQRYQDGGEVDENRPRSAERRPYFRVPDMKTGEYDDIRLGRLRNVFTRLLRDPTDEDSKGKKLALLAGEIGLSPFKVADMFLEFSTGATPIDSINLYYDRPERVFRDSPGVSKYSPYNVERKDYTEEFSPEEFRQYRPNDEGPRPSLIPGFQNGGSVYNIGDPGPYQDSLPFGELETQEEKIRRMDQELMNMLNEDDAEMSEIFKERQQRFLDNSSEEDRMVNPDDVYGEGSDTTYGDDAFARELYEREQRQKIQEVLKSLGQGEGLAHGGAVRPRGYNMGGAVMPPPQQQPQGIATMMSDPRTNMGNMPNQQQQQQQQQLSALQTTANAANLNANNLQKTMQKQQQQAMASGENKVTSPISQIRIPSTKRRQFEDTLLNSRRRGQKASQDAQMRASIPSTMFG